MQTRKLDLNLLVVFDALFRLGSVTAAGAELGLSQPAVSYALLKMRKSFGDPLFVRVASGMQPTAHALSLAPTVREVLDRVESGLLATPHFDPAQSDRTFRIASSDFGESFFAPPLMRAFKEQGASLSLHFVSLTPEVLQRQLESGEIDMAMGHYPDLVGADFYQQGLFTSRFVCIAARGNPHVQKKLTMRRFLQAPHVDVMTPGRSQEIILRYITENRIVRHVPLRVSRFLSLFEIVAKTDLIAMVPQDVAAAFADSKDLTVHQLPFESPTFRLQQYWHKRFHDDSGLRWLRQLSHATFKDT